MNRKNLLHIVLLTIAVIVFGPGCSADKPPTHGTTKKTTPTEQTSKVAFGLTDSAGNCISATIRVYPEGETTAAATLTTDCAEEIVPVVLLPGTYTYDLAPGYTCTPASGSIPSGATYEGCEFIEGDPFEVEVGKTTPVKIAMLMKYKGASDVIAVFGVGGAQFGATADGSVRLICTDDRVCKEDTEQCAVVDGEGPACVTLCEDNSDCSSGSVCIPVAELGDRIIGMGVPLSDADRVCVPGETGAGGAGGAGGSAGAAGSAGMSPIAGSAGSAGATPAETGGNGAGGSGNAGAAGETSSGGSSATGGATGTAGSTAGGSTQTGGSSSDETAGSAGSAGAEETGGQSAGGSSAAGGQSSAGATGMAGSAGSGELPACEPGTLRISFDGNGIVVGPDHDKAFPGSDGMYVMAGRADIGGWDTVCKPSDDLNSDPFLFACDVTWGSGQVWDFQLYMPMAGAFEDEIYWGDINYYGPGCPAKWGGNGDVLGTLTVTPCGGEPLEVTMVSNRITFADPDPSVNCEAGEMLSMNGEVTVP